MAPYKKPLRDLPDNEFFNNHLSILCIQSEHAIGFLKGRFASLKDLRIDIRNEKSHKFTTYWIACCIGLHTFAMMHEEQNGEGVVDKWDFINEGLSSSDSDGDATAAAQQGVI